MGGKCSMRVGDKKSFSLVREQMGCENLERIHLNQDRDQEQTFVNTVLNLQFP
jgi:hypothetical protein